ncbi:CKLF-like MARVEL transmembrane domain-containing protein 8 isoform X2 [Homo sapiens]|uniref:CKLF-like MARVEL transmembrane domain-containing protein 8 isoform X2 n=1 Tax=Homo sapiens TaxID=9606 RepID=UPI001FB1304A|nr:CKLF-like MARVEL transmembrane domain-containing protein 8 isoform X2 [Homo sapiens]XP_054201360.1 CKLF-like MARVEL transmembrane domain-containing protein 8 isoform X2 [Homo sapiens]
MSLMARLEKLLYRIESYFTDKYVQCMRYWVFQENEVLDPAFKAGYITAVDNHKTMVLGLLVWTLIAGTEYFRVPAFGWVMFVAVFYWVLTVFFLIIYITMTYTRIPQVPWTTVGLCFNGSAFVLYLSAAVVDASSVSPERDSHNFNSWAASSFFAFLVTICYAGNTYFSFIAWRSRTIQ